MADRFNFIKSRLDGLEFSPDKGISRNYYYDTVQSCLRLQVTPKSVKSFQVYKKLSHKPITVTLGRYPTMTIDQARKHAQLELAKIVDGINPNQQKRVKKVKSLSLREVLEDWIKHENPKPSSIKTFRYYIEANYLSAWKDTPLNSITRKMTKAKHGEISKKSKAAANTSIRIISALYNFAYKHYLNSDESRIFSADNPASFEKSDMCKLSPKQSYIAAYDIKPFYDAALELSEQDKNFNDAKDFALLSVLTGFRLNEALNLKWPDFDQRHRTLILHDTKNSKKHLLPLSDFLANLLKSRYQQTTQTEGFIFDSELSQSGHKTGFYNFNKRVKAMTGVKFSHHDFRRTFLNMARNVGVHPYDMKSLVNHSSSGNDVTFGYMVFDLEEKRKLIQKITDYFLRLASEQPQGEVIELNPKQEKELRQAITK